MGEILDDASQVRRLADVDASMRTLNVIMAVLVAGSAALFLPRFGVAFSAFAALPLLYWLIRFSPAGKSLGVRRWCMVLVTTMTISIVGGAWFSGGADSPVVFFAGIVALLGNAMFPNLKLFTGIGTASILLLAGADLVAGRSVEPIVLLCAVVIAGYLPFFADRMVTLEQQQRRRAVIDPLTGCLNRYALDARSVELEEQGRRTESELAVIMFDLDHFKRVNDEHGHATGDEVLAQVANVTRKKLRRFELMYRLGGEEFAVLLPGADLVVATAIAEKIRVAIEAEPIAGVAMTASFGVATSHSPFSVGRTIERADLHLYGAKKSGRNKVVNRASVIELETPVTA